ncbi:MAG: uracil-DNA glycosylase family protein [Halioglobus sp.]
MPDTDDATITLRDLLAQVRDCRHCEEFLPLGPRPVVRAHAQARLLIIGQAPGTRVHASGVPWDDPSGDRLRDWLSVDKDRFYDESQIAIMPMGFCYPGKGKSGDLPPTKPCAPLWHQRLLEQMPAVELTLLVGRYAQDYYLNDKRLNLTQRVQDWQRYAPEFLPLPHPSPRNQFWLRRNAWFEQEVVPALRARVAKILC